MDKIQEQAFKLRRRGYSYNEINHLLGVPKSTLSSWFREFVLSDKAQERLALRMKSGSSILIQRNRLQTQQAWNKARQIQYDALQDIGCLSEREVLLISAALYWAEGHKKLTIKDGKERTSHAISLANSDPAIVRLFVRFLQEIMNISSSHIRIAMRLYDHINESKARSYWRKVTGLEDTNFDKALYLVSISSKRKRPFNRLPYGTVQIRVGDTKNFHKLIGWIEGIKKSARIEESLH